MISKDKIDTLYPYFEDRSIAKAKGLYVSKNIINNELELVVDIGGVKGFIKADEFDLEEINCRKLSDYILKEFYVAIKSIEEDKIYVSRKEAQYKIIKEYLKVGQEYEGIFKNILDYGAYITIYDDMVTCFAKKESIVDKSMSVRDICNKNQKVTVIIKSISEEKIYVEIKDKLFIDNSIILNNIKENDIVYGKISVSTLEKCYVRIAPGIDVLCSSQRGLYKGDKVDIEIIKVDLEKNILRGTIIDFDKLSKFIENLEIGDIVKGSVKEIATDYFYVKIYTCLYVKCRLEENNKVSIGENVNIRLKSIDYNNRNVIGEYINTINSDENLVIKGDVIRGIVKSKQDNGILVDTNKGFKIFCKNSSSQVNIDDEVYVDITYVHNSNSVYGIIIDEKIKDEYIQKREVDEELKGYIFKIEDNTCYIKISVGVDMICELPKDIEITKEKYVKVKISEICYDSKILKGEIIELLLSKVEQSNNNIEDINDFKRPFVVYGWETPQFTNKPKKNLNESAIYDMVYLGQINERDMDILRFLMDSRFATLNQVYRYISPDTTRENFKTKMKKLVEKRIINSFRLKNGNMQVYCIDIGGKKLLDREHNKKSIDWTYQKTDKPWNVIGKGLIATEISVRYKEKYENCEIIFDASPHLYIEENCKKSKQVVFSIKIKNKNFKSHIIGEVCRKGDQKYLLENRMNIIDKYLKEKMWQDKFEEYGHPKIVIVAEDDKMRADVENKIKESYQDIINYCIFTTDVSIDEDIFYTIK